MTTTQQIATLPILDLDHPGAHDLEYRKRREEIVRKATEFHTSSSKVIAVVTYANQEHKVWQHVCRKLQPLHEKWASKIYLEGRRILDLSEDEIPQLSELNTKLKQVSDFQLEPVHGLVESREFLAKLADNIMLCTQYIRHHSNPQFTPEPDVIHEILGHVPMWTNPLLVEHARLVGKAAKYATEEQLLKLSRLYWFTIEYGLIMEQGEVKALGAGLLGGIKDLTNAMTGNAIVKPFVMQEVVNTDYNYSFEQPVFFVLPSLEFLLEETKKLIAGFEKV